MPQCAAQQAHRTRHIMWVPARHISPACQCDVHPITLLFGSCEKRSGVPMMFLARREENLEASRRRGDLNCEVGLFLGRSFASWRGPKGVSRRW